MKNLIIIQYNKHKETVANFTWRSLQIFGQQGITFLIFILSAKILSPYDFGIYNYTLAIIFFLIMFGDFGISTATSKYVAEYNFTDKEKLKAVLFNSSLLILGLTILITIVTLILGSRYLHEKYVYVLYLLPLVFLSPMTSLYDGAYRGLKKFKQLTIISFAVSFFSVFFVYTFIKSYGLFGALISQNIFYVILLVALGLGYKGFHFRFNRAVMKEVGKYSFIYGLAIMGNYLFIRFGILILGHYGYIKQIATYELINKFFTIFLIPFTLLGQVVAPNFVEMSIKKEYLKIYSKLKLYTMSFFLIGIILGLFFYFLMPLFVKILLNKYYTDLFFKILPFSIIIFTTNIWAATVDAGILIPTGFAGLMAKFYLVLGLFGCLLGLFLTKQIGYMGVIYSFAISNIIMVVGLRIMVFLKIKKLIS